MAALPVSLVYFLEQLNLLTLFHTSNAKYGESKIYD